MPDMTMIEKVARAMCAPRYGVSWESIGPETREYLMYDAHAAIEAMREPSNAMLSAAHDIDPALPIEHVRRLWWLMLQAALKETP